jgi:sulfur-oxidizing protein SoxY
MKRRRRELVRAAGLAGTLGAAGWLPAAARAQAQPPAHNRAAFEAKSLADVVRALGGSGATESRDIAITAPDIAENGAAVPVTIASRVPGTQAIYILVDRNANWLAAAFSIPPGTEPSITTRIKMAQSANVLALVRANDRFYVARREVTVTLGGCGG